jgi:peptide/nickel transport system permease protein
VEAAGTLGVPGWRIMVWHIWPNVSPVAVANAFLNFAGSLTALAGRSFLGLGVAPGTPDWGLMLSEGLQDLFVNPVAVLAPGVMIKLLESAPRPGPEWLAERESGAVEPSAGRA